MWSSRVSSVGKDSAIGSDWAPWSGEAAREPAAEVDADGGARLAGTRTVLESFATTVVMLMVGPSIGVGGRGDWTERSSKDNGLAFEADWRALALCFLADFQL